MRAMEYYCSDDNDGGAKCNFHRREIRSAFADCALEHVASHNYVIGPRFSGPNAAGFVCGPVVAVSIVHVVESMAPPTGSHRAEEQRSAFVFQI